jgi:hypothetical protein
VQTKTSPDLNIHPKEFVTRNFFAPIRTADMDTDASGTEATSNEEALPGKTGRPPPITQVCKNIFFSAAWNIFGKLYVF